MSTFLIKNVRMSFPHFFRKSVFDGVEGEYDGLFILDKPKGEHKAIIAKINAAVKDALQREVAGEKPKARYNAWKSDKERDVMENNRPEYAGCMTLKAKNKVRPHVIGADREPLMEEDGLIFAGGRCNVKVNMWINKKGKYAPGVGFNLLAVQHIPTDEDQEDAQPFGESSVSFEEAIDGFDIEEDDDDIMGDLDEDDDDL